LVLRDLAGKYFKALNLARNLGPEVKDFVTANFDMIHHYRPAQNVVCRPVSSGAKAIILSGHHELCSLYWPRQSSKSFKDKNESQRLKQIIAKF